MLGILAGFIFAFVYIWYEWDPTLPKKYIKPFGFMFLNALKFVAVPLSLSAIILGVNNVGDTTKLSRIGGKAVGLYTLTTILSVGLGLLIATLLKPGKLLKGVVAGDLSVNPQLFVPDATDIVEPSWVEKLGGIIPDNFVASLSNNDNLLQIIIFAVVMGVAIMQIKPASRKVMVSFCQSVNDTFIVLCQFIMKLAPLGVFALVSSVLIEQSAKDLSSMYGFVLGIAAYTATVVGSLLFMLLVAYPMLVTIFSPIKAWRFIKTMRPVQLVAFGTSSSSATLPVTMRCVEKGLGVPKQVSSFVLPLGATVNMDGTAIYQGIAVLFIAQAYGITLTLSQYITIVTYITVSSIGVAGIPGASLGATGILLGTLGLPIEGLSLIMIPDRLLDMLRTAANVTGDAAVAVIVGSSVKKREARLKQEGVS